MGDDQSPSTGFPWQKGIEEYLSASGIFTETDRLYLLGERTFENERTEQKRRQRIRDRLQTAFLDLNLAATHLSDRDRHLLFTGLVEDASPTQGWQESLRHGQVGGLQQTLSFIYDGLAEETAVSARALFAQTGVVGDQTTVTAEQLDGLVGALLGGEVPTLTQYACLVELLGEHPPALADISDEVSDTQASTDIDRKLACLHALVQRELPELWRPVLIAGQFPWDEETLTTLQEQTARARS